ncbi:hypothetical protein FRX31_006997 [Thalictrum thalictroides]|uniref:Uncharacterized protein n=1 Tax=Thalictrum thalictroides TaxID=46969 RepID=A0A7J6X2X1_THATH|nr:hypothetical protein FRX31_006997 [Thalictrum thalictroides]
MNVDGDLHEAVWIEGHNYTNFWQPLFYPNFLYCSKLGHSFENCRKRKTNYADKGKGKEGGITSNANPTTTHTTTKTTHQTGPIYKATGNLFTNIPSGNLENTMETGTSTENSTQGTKKASNTQAHTPLMLMNSFDVLNEDHADDNPVIQPANNEVTQSHIPETVVSPYSERSNAPSIPSTSTISIQQNSNNISVAPAPQKDDVDNSPSRQQSP